MLKRLLVVDDDEVMRRLLAEVLVKEGFAVEMAQSGEEAVSRVERTKEPYPVIVSDIRMLETDGLEVLARVKKRDSRTSVILMTGFGSMDGAIEAIQKGAFDYVSKPFKMEDLKALVNRAYKQWESLTEIEDPTRAQKGTQFKPIEVSSQSLVGKSAKMLEVFKTVARAALSTSNVLISGERGTGKGLVAQAIHLNSQKKKSPFVAMNCGSVDDTTFDADLKEALRESADGTLYLQEVTSLSHPNQMKLLKVISKLETGPRIVASANSGGGTSNASVTVGLSEDLYYRLKVISIDLPALRERADDLSELVGSFVVRFGTKNQKRISHVSDEAMSLLRTYSWPGNIRELEHAIERAVALATGPVLFPDDLPVEIRKAVVSHDASASHSLEELEKAHILQVLNETGFNKSKASEILGIDRATLYRKAQRYGIDLRRREERS